MKEVLESMDWKMIGGGGLIGWFSAGNIPVFIVTVFGWMMYCFLVDQWKLKVELERQNKIVEEAFKRIADGDYE